jgi:hypothetical protein
LKADPVFAIAPAGVKLTVHIPPDPLNRAVAIVVECENFSTSSDKQLDGTDSDPTFFVLNIPRLPVGECVAQAGLVRSSASPLKSPLVTFGRS